MSSSAAVSIWLCCFISVSRGSPMSWEQSMQLGWEHTKHTRTDTHSLDLPVLQHSGWSYYITLSQQWLKEPFVFLLPPKFLLSLPTHWTTDSQVSTDLYSLKTFQWIVVEYKCVKEKLLPFLTQLFNLVRILHEHMDNLESMLLNPSLLRLWTCWKAVLMFRATSFYTVAPSLVCFHWYIYYLATDWLNVSGLQFPTVKVTRRSETTDRLLSFLTWMTILKRSTDHVKVVEWG